jgi:CheY-like chemotaxis protein
LPAPLTILVVDDDADNRAVLGDLLELNGYAVQSCGVAEQAVDVARRTRPALILLDYLMPGADGAAVVRALREARIEVPVVLTTGLNEGREEAARLGLPSMEKPFDVGRLLELIGSLVRKK